MKKYIDAEKLVAEIMRFSYLQSPATSTNLALTQEGRTKYMSKDPKINQDTICKLVYAELNKLPKQYVVAMDMRRSRGAANVNVGGTKFELHVKIFDSDVEDWTLAPNVGSFTFEDSDGIIWWPDIYSAFVKRIKELLKTQERRNRHERNI